MAPTASAPSTAERWNCRASRRQAQLRLKFGDPRDKRLDPRDSAAIKASFSGKSGPGGVTRTLTHIRDVAATKKNTAQTPAHLHTLKNGA